MRKRDGVRLLPKRITETLVRAFAALPAVNTDVLILQPVTEPHAPLWQNKDYYNVLWMGEKVGRIYLNLERFEAREFNTPWCWSFSPPTLGRSAYGYVATRRAAMAHCGPPGIRSRYPGSPDGNGGAA